MRPLGGDEVMNAHKKDLRGLTLLPREGTAGRCHLGTSKEQPLAKDPVCSYLDLGLPGLQNRKKQTNVFCLDATPICESSKTGVRPTRNLSIKHNMSGLVF